MKMLPLALIAIATLTSSAALAGPLTGSVAGVVSIGGQTRSVIVGPGNISSGAGGVTVNQNATNNVAGVVQAGRSTSATVIQSGRTNQAQTFQFGRNNNAVTLQNGRTNNALISQHGRNNAAGIGQKGLFNTGTVRQSRPDRNTATGHQSRPEPRNTDPVRIHGVWAYVKDGKTVVLH